MPVTVYLRHGFMLHLSFPFSDLKYGIEDAGDKKLSFSISFSVRNGNTCKYSRCTGKIGLQCFDAVGWAAGRASGP